jgi:hypothetical protein
MVSGAGAMVAVDIRISSSVTTKPAFKVYRLDKHRSRVETACLMDDTGA